MSEGEVIELTIEETNRLRAELGLKPLTSIIKSRKPNEAIQESKVGDDPALATTSSQALRKRIEDAKLKRDVEAGLMKMKSEESEDGNAMGIGEWANKLRYAHLNPKANVSQENSSSKEYTVDEMMEQNIMVSHSTSSFELGSSTILTLADRSLMNDDSNEHELENVNLTEKKVIEDNLREKRLFATGYRGLDDDEFDETGQGNRLVLGRKTETSKSASTNKKLKLNDLVQGMNRESGDLFASEKGLPISLQSTWNPRAQQKDFMTAEEETDEYGPALIRNPLLKSHGKKRKDRQARNQKIKGGTITDKTLLNDSKQEPLVSKEAVIVATSESDLIKDLEANADRHHQNLRRRRRNLEVDSSDDEKHNTDESKNSSKATKEDENAISGGQIKDESMSSEPTSKASLYDKYLHIMDKANIRSDLAFNRVPSKSSNTSQPDLHHTDESLEKSVAEKAARLARLKALHQRPTELKGAAAVAFAVKSLEKTPLTDEDSNKQTKIAFHLDSARDFALSLQSKPQYTEAVKRAQVHDEKVSFTPKTKIEDDQTVKMDSLDDNEETIPNDFSTDIDDTLLGSSANSMTIGRGLANVISLLKHTGEITGKNAGREEMKGRAKDVKTYEDYEKLDLKNVVKIDRSRTVGGPHEKDIEYANREIKLDYRDEDGRLLTRKEAYRNLCYQFHGFSSGKKNQERRMKHIERERLEKESSSKLESKSTLTALKATQKATGKAFVVHKS